MNDNEQTKIENMVIRAGIWQLTRRAPTWLVAVVTVGAMILVFATHK